MTKMLKISQPLRKILSRTEKTAKCTCFYNMLVINDIRALKLMMINILN